MAGALGNIYADDDPYGEDDADTDDQGDPGALDSLGDDGNAPQGVLQGIQDARSIGRQLVGDDPSGALSNANVGFDAAVAQKRAGIQRAFDILSAAGQRGNIPEMAYYAALGQPTRTGSFGESMSNAGMAKVEALSKDRDFDMERAKLLANQQERLGSLDVEAAKAHEGFLKDRLTLGTNTLDKAARLEAQIAQQQRIYHSQEQARTALSDYRKQTLAARAQTEARLSAQTEREGQLERIADRLRGEDPTLSYADSIGKARAVSMAGARETFERKPGFGPDPADPKKLVEGTWEHNRNASGPGTFYPGEVQGKTGAASKETFERRPGLGPDANDPTKQVEGTWEMNRNKPGPGTFHPGVILSNRGAGGAGGGSKSVAQWKYDAWLEIHPDDKQGALDFVGGHKTMGQEEALKFAYSEAGREAAASGGSTPAEIDSRAKAIASTLAPGKAQGTAKMLPGSPLARPGRGPVPAAQLAKPQQTKSKTSPIPAGARTATDAKGNKVYFDGKAWVLVK